MEKVMKKKVLAAVVISIMHEGQRFFPGTDEDPTLVPLDQEEFDELKAYGAVRLVEESIDGDDTGGTTLQVDQGKVPESEKLVPTADKTEIADDTDAPAVAASEATGTPEKEALNSTPGDASDAAAGDVSAPATADSIEQIVAVIPQLKPEDYTQGGVPEVKALETLLNSSVSAADRDAAWELHQQSVKPDA